MTEADGHTFMAGCRSGSIGAKNPVPPGKVKSEITIGFSRDHRMMHPMHFRRNYEETQYLINQLRQTHVAVIEKACSIQENLEKNHSQRGDPQNKNSCDLYAHGNKNFQGVKTNSGCCIEIKIHMVYHGQTPKDGEREEHGMLQIDDKIKNHYADEYPEPIGQPALNQKTPAFALI